MSQNGQTHFKNLAAFKNRKLINSQVNWFIRINVNVEVFSFFSTTAVSVTDQFWLISCRKFLFF